MLLLQVNLDHCPSRLLLFPKKPCPIQLTPGRTATINSTHMPLGTPGADFNRSDYFFLCPNLGNLIGIVIKTVNTAKMTVMMKVALRDEA